MHGADLPPLHTYTAGAARPSDLDQPAVAAYLHTTKPEETLAKVQTVTDRLDETKEKALGKDWVATWWKGLPKSDKSKHLVEHNQIVWMHNVIKAFGMYEFAKARYNSFEKNGEKWDDNMTVDENIEKNIGKNPWGFVPGLPLKLGVDYDNDLVNVPEENKALVKEAEAFVYTFCRDPHIGEKKEEPKFGPRRRSAAFFRRNFSVSSQLFNLPSFLTDIANSNRNGPSTEEGKEDKVGDSDLGKDEAEVGSIPKEWETAHDMRPWPDFPDRPSRA